MWIVKLGGSLIGSPELPRWLDVLARHGDGRIVIVPGGGLFADAVRDAQRLTDMGDATAHHLALLAMDQYGLLLTSLCPQLVTAASELELAERSWQHRAIVWLPSKMVLAEENIPQSWEMTSDSLAAWLASRLQASRLVLVKSVAPELLDGAEQALQVVDAKFHEYVRGGEFQCSITTKSAHEHFESSLQSGEGTGVRIIF